MFRSEDLSCLCLCVSRWASLLALYDWEGGAVVCGRLRANWNGCVAHLKKKMQVTALAISHN